MWPRTERETVFAGSTPSVASHPESIGAYRVVRRIAAGGSGETFEVVWHGADGTEGRGCLKRLHAHRAQDPQSRALFVREARIAGRLQHGNLVDILDHNLQTDRPYVVFAFVDGVDLRVLREKGKLTPERVLWIGNRVAAALHYAHSFRDGEIRGVVHRDVTPGNILVSVEGVVKLADFGLARVRTHETASLTVESQVNGTLPYLAPELIVGGRASERSDLYGLGAVLYELAVGEPPFSGTNSYELIKKVCEGHFSGPPLKEAADAFPAEFVELVTQMLARRPEDRPESALEVQLRFEACGASRRERRPLGAVVRELHEELRTVAAGPEQRHATFSREPPSRTAAPSNKPRRWRLLIAALFGLGTLAVAGVMIAHGSALEKADHLGRGAHDRTSTSEVSSQGTTAADPLQEAPPAPEPAAAVAGSRPAADDRRTTPAKARATPERGVLRVLADPWGNVWINDEKIGRAPVRRSVRPGVHKVQIGDEYPEEPKYVRVRPGEGTKITLQKAEIE